MGLVGDLARLAFEFDCVCDGVDFNLRGWSSLQPLSGGLTGLANRVLGTSVEQSKAVTRSNWNLRPLSEIQMLYIAEDAYMSWKIAMTLLQTECKVQEDWFVTMAEMYGSGKEFWQHGLTVPESCHDWSMAQHEWQLKQEAKKQKLRDKEIERRKKDSTRIPHGPSTLMGEDDPDPRVWKYEAGWVFSLRGFFNAPSCWAPQEPEISPEEKAAARLCKYIPDEESGGEGRWEFPFLAERRANERASFEELMEQASKAVWKLEDFTPPSIEVPEEEEKEDPKAKAKAKGKAKAKEKPKKEEEAEKPPPQPAPALFVDLQQALLAERVTFRQRLQMIQGWAIRRLHQAASSTKSTFRDLNDWILLRRHKDLEAVASLVDVLKDRPTALEHSVGAVQLEQVESEDFIKTKLCLKNAHLHQRPNTLLRAPKPEKVPPEVEGVAPFRWTMEQLDLLFEVVASAAAAISPSCRVLPNYTLLRILEQLTSADGGDKRTVKVPANWRNCGEAKLKQMLAAFDHPYSGSCIDLVDFLFHMLLLHSPVGWPSLNTLMEVRRVLEAQAPRGAIWPDFYVPGHVVESLPLFEESGEESFAKKFKPITTLAPNMFDRPGAQLKWVAKVLQRYRAPSGEHEAWSVEVAWYDYRVQRHEDSERLVEMLDDVRSTPTDTPRQPVDNIPALLGHEENENPDDAVSTGCGYTSASPMSETETKATDRQRQLSASTTEPMSRTRTRPRSEAPLSCGSTVGKTTTMAWSRSSPPSPCRRLWWWPFWDTSRYELMRVLRAASKSWPCQIEIHFDTLEKRTVAVKRFAATWIQAQTNLQDLPPIFLLEKAGGVNFTKSDAALGAFQDAQSGEVLLLCDQELQECLFDHCAKMGPPGPAREEEALRILRPKERRMTTSHSFKVLLSDFGSIEEKGEAVFLSESDSLASDLFSCGVLGYALAMGRYPWFSTMPGKCKAFAFVRANGIRSFLADRRCPASKEGRMSEEYKESCS
eukprot:g28706.t1